MNTVLQREILTEGYEDMKRLVFQTVWRFYRRNGGDFEELSNQANLLFVEAFNCHNESKGKLTTCIVSYINSGLRIYSGKEYKQRHILMDNEKIDNRFQTSKSLSIMDLLDEMEQDAHIILQLFLETPTEVIQNALDEGTQLNHIQGMMKKRLKNRCRQLGWTIDRIKKTFKEIKKAIN